MRSLSASELLKVWEWGQAQSPIQRVLMLLSTAYPGTPSDELAKLSIGQRDARLLTLREWIFGPQLVSLVTCPACGERLELSFKVSDIRVEPGTEPDESLSVSISGYEVHFRLPNSLDLEAIANNQDLIATRQLLLKRCLLHVYHNGQVISAEQLPANVIEAVIEKMAKVDPQADVQLTLSCPLCSHGWQTTFDIGSFFWGEINAWAYRMLHEIHNLASAYGWREADILALSPWRRQYYLELVNR